MSLFFYRHSDKLLKTEICTWDDSDKERYVEVRNYPSQFCEMAESGAQLS